ncbi:hypothetical protein GCM10017673_11290 [Streptosporangium violaceochromogenes]|nr:hypothetical protein GCM10017673_11290 [Streptosporangium violaceochromogenes]
MAAHERRDEDLILGAELSQLRQFEPALDRDAVVRQAHPFDDERPSRPAALPCPAPPPVTAPARLVQAAATARHPAPGRTI